MPITAYFLHSCSKISFFCFCKLQIYWTNVHNVITQLRGVTAAINARIYKTILHFVSERQSKEWRRPISTSAKRPQNQFVTIAIVTWATVKHVSFIISIQMSTNANMLVKFGLVFAEIFGNICRFLPSRPKSYRNSGVISEVSKPIVIKLAKNV